MLELKDGFVLYHGSYCEVKEPDLAKCAKRKDFGQGFYLTTSKDQAESFLRTSIAKAIATGKIADDATNATLTAYLAGAFGTAGDEEADDFCIRQLLPNKLKDQYCFKTEAAIDCLKFVKGEKIWLK
ncbi:DUF3990 domain-containing protein [Blautia sp. MSJ-19]|uniref:DUF3990 domain-containing protein n=1 Tax=Blautia sp. MSJ-19 TaxID=2841517 RepID=UPI001C0EEEC7|nr:DUF3990 domain-containing protein [Blautia sp. MSJ-19]MBU5479681.1 DUF3990 domain-containing protein [Blautia sp. MSJ-19]